MPNKLGLNRRKALAKCFTQKKKKTVRKTDTCLADKSAEEPIVHEEPADVEDAVFTLELVDCAGASPKHSSSPDKSAEEPIVHEAPADVEDTVFSHEPVDCARASPKHSRSPPQARASALFTSQLTKVVPFEVAEIELLEETSEGVSPETAYELQSGPEAETKPRQQQQAPVSPSEAFNLNGVKTRIKQSLPPYWYCSDWSDSGDNGILLLKLSTGACFLPQRQIHISENGTVQLFVHGKTLGSNHEIWEKLPERISLATHSVDDSFEYVMAVVKLVHRYDICPGCPQPQDQDIARKMKNAIFSPNTFRERKYTTTHRSVDCGLLVVAYSKTSRCFACKNLQRNIGKRLARQQLKNINL